MVFPMVGSFSAIELHHASAIATSSHDDRNLEFLLRKVARDRNPKFKVSVYV
jgi:hypothetical protein